MFLKTYALNVIYGMWDDYWANANNYYFYFDENGKGYFIPYDYDNVLSTSGKCGIANPSNCNPLVWGYNGASEAERPLITKILSIEDFKAKYIEYLGSFIDATKASAAIQQMTTWQTMVKPYIDNADIKYDGITVPCYADDAVAKVDTYSTIRPASDFALYFENKIESIKAASIPADTEYTVKFILNEYAPDGADIQYWDENTSKLISCGNEYSTTVTINTELRVFPNVSAIGYEYDWYDEKGNHFDSSTKVTKDMTFHAEFIKLLTIRINSNGKTIFGSEYTNVSIPNGADIFLRCRLNDETKNYYITALSTDAAGNNTVTEYVEGGEYYAVWTFVTKPCSYDYIAKCWIFKFNPMDYDETKNLSYSEDSVICLRGNINGENDYWGSNDLRMTYDSENGIFTLSIADENRTNRGNEYKFYDATHAKWLGYDDISNNYALILAQTNYDEKGNLAMYD